MGIERVSDIVRKHPANPILDRDWLNQELERFPETIPEVSAVFNPGGVLTAEGEIILMVRFETRTGSSGLLACRSKDGLHFSAIPGSLRLSPIYYGGLEDPRIVWVAELEEYVITYVLATHAGSRIVFLRTKDFKSFVDAGKANFLNEEEAFLEDVPNKDACLLPRMININGEGEKCFGLIHRPDYQGKNMWFSYSVGQDLEKWQAHRCIAKTRPGTFWDNDRLGLSTQPVEIPEEYSRGMPEGLLLFYHGVQQKATGGALYRVAPMWFSLKDLKITHRSAQWVLGPEESYSSLGDVLGAVFPCAAWYGGNGNIIMYYGIADMSVGRVEWDLEKTIALLRKNPV